MNDEYKKHLKDAWSNIESDKLRKMYWVIKKTDKRYLNQFDIFKMNTFKEILNTRLEW